MISALRFQYLTAGLNILYTPNISCHTMPISIDHNEIQDALKQFEIPDKDYYLLFGNNVVYLVWCTTGAKAVMHTHHNECVDIEIKGTWHEQVPENYTLPTYACVRYILATN